MSLDLATLPVKQIMQTKWLLPKEDDPQPTSAGTALPPRRRHAVGPTAGASGNRESVTASATTFPGAPVPAFEVDTSPDHLQTLWWRMHAYEQAQAAFAKGRFIALHEGFEMGMDNEFRTALHRFLLENRDSAISIIDLDMPKMLPAVQAETLIDMAEIDQPETIATRVALAMKHLKSTHPEVRDAAGLALVDLGSTIAIPWLEAAIARERLPLLKRNLEQALNYLKRHG